MASKILISACLLGQKVLYNGGDHLQVHPRLQEWIKQNRVVSICPEVSGGLAIPRPPAEIQERKVGADVLNGHARILTVNGDDVTREFVQGAHNALSLAQLHGIRVAILKQRSPSCGSVNIYDGTFSRTTIAGMGATAALLHQHGIAVFGEEQIDEALDAADLVI